MLKRMICKIVGHVHPVKGHVPDDYDYFICERCGHFMWYVPSKLIDCGLPPR